MINNTAKITLRERHFKTIFFIALHALILGALIYSPNLMVSTILSFVIYYLVEPVVEKLEDRGLSRTYASALPFIILGFLLTLMMAWLFPLLAKQIEALQAQLPEYTQRMKQIGEQWESTTYPWLKQLGQNSMVEATQTYIFSKVSTFFSQIPHLLSSSLTVFLLTPFFGFFLLCEGANLYRKFLKLVPNHLFELTVNINYSINIQMGQFIRARLLETALISLFIFIGLSFIHFPYSLIFAIITGLLNLVPYLGPVVAAIPQILLCLISPELRGDIVPILLINIGSQIFDAVILVPLLVAKIVDLHPVLVVLAVIFGGQLMGVLGMIISIPLASALKVFITAFYKYMTHSR